ncbi:MAG TPA: trypsin-like peptidase domain-containing protein [Pirellulales bacterium]|nr:trypsin-like peptidase domain-containing protein [Pirellulales bacterium]
MFNRRALLAIALFSCGVSAGAAFVFAVGGTHEGEEPLTAEQRVDLYQSLNQQVDALEAQFNVLKTVVKLVSPTVVHIKAEKPERHSSRTQHLPNEKVEEAGSGVIIDYKGRTFVLTNRHVIKNAQLKDIYIGLSDGRDLRPLKVWEDADTDVALMAVSASELVPAKLGDSSAVQIGDFVLAVGSPFGLSHSVTYGIISAKGRRDLELGDDVALQDFMQTDAAINPGNSGGPLINLRGEVIGINTAIASNSGGNEGIGFSIPINAVMHIVRQFVERGRVVRAFLGVSLDQRFTSTVAVKLGLRRKQGAHVTAVTDGGPAQAAHLQRGDVILRFNGVRVENDTHLIYLVSLTEVGKEVPMEVFRAGQVFQVNVKVGNKSDFPQQR